LPQIHFTLPERVVVRGRAEQGGVTVVVGVVCLSGDNAGKTDSMANERCDPCYAGIWASPTFGLEFLKWRMLALLEKQKAIVQDKHINDCKIEP
jgi:hypothetical protein